MVYIGIDLGGTGIAVGIVTEEGKIIQKGSTPTLAMRPYQEIVKDMAAVSLEILKEAGLTIQDVHSVGIGVPGIANPNTGVVVFCTNLSWHDVPLREEFQKYIDKPVFIDNDATVAGYAESVAGISAGCHSSVFLTLGTGVGGGIVINGKPWSGFHNVGSEIGHITLELDGEPCSCGNKGCLERYCSATAIIRMARQALAVHPESLMMELCQNNLENVNAKLVFDAAREGDETALKIFRRYVKYMAQAVNNIIAFLDPEVIVLGGGISKAGDFLLDAIRAEVPQYLMFKTMPHPRIEIASLGAEAGIIGAAMLGK
jgi:glucokinase